MNIICQQRTWQSTKNTFYQSKTQKMSSFNFQLFKIYSNISIFKQKQARAAKSNKLMAKNFITFVHIGVASNKSKKKLKEEFYQLQLIDKICIMQSSKKSSLLITPIIPTIQAEDKGVLTTILSASAQISRYLRSSPTVVLDSKNAFGDQQLHQDVNCDEIVQKYLRADGTIAGFASQERPEFMKIDQVQGKEQKYIVTYDPLDGSSIVDTNFAVGSIFSIWPYDTKSQKPLIGVSLDHQINSVLIVYGSRTTALIFNSQKKCVEQYTLIQTYTHSDIRKDQWVCSRSQLKIAPKTKMFSPGNLRAATENKAYHEGILNWIDKGYTLRYTGGMVPDVYQIFIKGHGVFTNVPSQKHKAKLRILYEVAAVAFLFEKAGGMCIACNGKKQDPQNGKRLLQCFVKGYDDRMGLISGSSEEVEYLINIKCLEG